MSVVPSPPSTHLPRPNLGSNTFLSGVDHNPVSSRIGPKIRDCESPTVFLQRHRRRTTSRLELPRSNSIETMAVECIWRQPVEGAINTAHLVFCLNGLPDKTAGVSPGFSVRCHCRGGKTKTSLVSRIAECSVWVACHCDLWGVIPLGPLVKVSSVHHTTSRKGENIQSEGQESAGIGCPVCTVQVTRGKGANIASLLASIASVRWWNSWLIAQTKNHERKCHQFTVCYSWIKFFV